MMVITTWPSTLCLLSTLALVIFQNITLIITLSDRTNSLIPMDLTFHPNKVLTILFVLCCVVLSNYTIGAYLPYKRIGVTSLDIQDYLADQ